MTSELTPSEKDPLTKNKQLAFSESENVVICENCHAQVNGMYCSQCGQSVESTLKYFWTVILHLLDDIFSFDSRANRTLIPLVFRPGFLTKEYIAGRRVHYVPPLRLYLFISIVFFISLQYFIDTEEASNFKSNANNADVIQQIETKLTTIDHLIETSPNEQASSLRKQKQQLEHIKADIAQNEDDNLSSLASQLAQLSLDESLHDQPMQKEKYDKLKKQLELARNAEKKAKPKGFTIGNNKDGSFTLPFLSDSENIKLGKIVDGLETKANKAFFEDPKKLVEAVIGKMPQIMFVLMPLFAVLLKVMFIFSKRLYLEHLTVALHSHSFIFFSILLAELSGLARKFLFDNSYETAGDLFNVIQMCIFIWIPVYLFLMQKRVYQQGTLLTTVKYMFIGSIYIIMIGFSAAIAFIWGVVDL
ncbi:DUF3667 domain-containing protein [Thalassotalea sp. M1531]|uniref:DUF3667 domain-containing protein n=1 Tax=Thalassotalea algicola TaxID=2716224 RepID=A0A7Y0L993_9GAMM|nr:DUF3667 domain-containing protein [Thalassotalea algicola]NMP29984.1 DUF3667 domain-containing protein [Thalassotalea algicola]